MTGKDTDRVRVGPELLERLLRAGVLRSNRAVLSLAHACGLKPEVIRRAAQGGFLQRAHWENLASYLYVPGVPPAVKARWLEHRREAARKRLAISKALGARAGRIPHELRIARLDSTRKK
jgi:hypothetical protein